MYQSRYRQNLHTEGTRVYSYSTHVANVDHINKTVWRLGWWSVTTSKHINYIASLYGYPVKDAPKEAKQEAESEQEAERAGQLKSVAMVASLASIFCDTPKQKADWKKRMIKAGVVGASFPDDFDTLTAKEQNRRLDGAIKILKETGKK